MVIPSSYRRVSYVCINSMILYYYKVPLQGAAVERDLTMVEALLKAGAASSGERERDGQTPLHAAAEGGRYTSLFFALR